MSHRLSSAIGFSWMIMRIRKHASEILGTASSLPPPPFLADVSLSGYICVLNQSSWDVFPFHSPHNPQEEGYMGDDINGEELMIVVTSEESNGMKEEKDAALILKKVKKAEEKKVSEKKVKEDSGSTTGDGAPITFTCKKTDGKQWRCNRPAPEPNSLCDYHLTQIKSYNCKSPSVAKATRIDKSTGRKRMTMPPATSVVSDIYYYSSFGPWRGKQRGGGDIGKHRSAVAAAKEESDIEEESCRNVAVNYADESYEYCEMEDKQMGNDTNAAMSCRKKRRKPVKARSLKSLM